MAIIRVGKTLFGEKSFDVPVSTIAIIGYVNIHAEALPSGKKFSLPTLNESTFTFQNIVLSLIRST